MAELARGTVSDRPWGQTLGALGARQLTGQLTVMADGKAYCIAFSQGAVVGASSPLASDAAVRVALTGNLVSSTQVSDITRRLAAAPGRDEIDVIAEAARLAPDQTVRLRRRVVAQRAARTFSVDRGEFVVEDRITVPVVPGGELDIRAIIYLGARSNLSAPRLEAELAGLGAWFMIKPDTVSELAQFGFTEADKPILTMLLEGANLADLETHNPTIDRATVRAVAYALAAYGACETTDAPRRSPRRDPPPPRPRPTSAAPTELRRPIPRPPSEGGGAVRRPASEPGAVKRAASEGGAVRRSQSTPPAGNERRAPSTPPAGGEDVVRIKAPTGGPPMRLDKLPPARPQRSSSQPPTSRPRRATAATTETEALIAQKIPQLEQGVDHFVLLGVAFDAPSEIVRNAYFNLARKLHPDRLAALGISDDNRDAQRLFAQINTAFAVLADPAHRENYLSMIRRGGEAAVRAEEAKADELAMTVMRAEELFRQGEMALRREALEQAVAAFAAAVELQPSESEYQALLAWSKFAAAPDKMASAPATRSALQRAASAAPQSATPRFYLGRVERMLGREKDALQLFHEVLQLQPNHAEASSEVRILEARMKAKR